ncbi:MAG TPA: hypothetical protein VJ302_04070 [Blastocatellia bacterium]|nr:hypothetical protein [Blastocatellia bacterium]
MPDAAIEQDPRSLQRRGEELKADVVTLAAQLTALEQESLRSPALFRRLGQCFGFGASSKLDWMQFKLRFMQEELARFEGLLEKLKAASAWEQTVIEPRSMPPASRVEETARHKMERMIADNPALLAPHIRRAYRPLIEAEEE